MYVCVYVCVYVCEYVCQPGTYFPYCKYPSSLALKDSTPWREHQVDAEQLK